MAIDKMLELSPVSGGALVGRVLWELTFGTTEAAKETLKESASLGNWMPAMHAQTAMAEQDPDALRAVISGPQLPGGPGSMFPAFLAYMEGRFDDAAASTHCNSRGIRSARLGSVAPAPRTDQVTAALLFGNRPLERGRSQNRRKRDRVVPARGRFGHEEKGGGLRRSKAQADRAAFRRFELGSLLMAESRNPAGVFGSSP